jgi:hypothetical protein
MILIEFNTLSENDFQQYALTFLDGNTLGEYAGPNQIDSHRFNNWLAIGNYPPVNFFNYGFQTSFSNSINIKSIFGYSGIVQTPTAKLSVLSKIMLRVGDIVETRCSPKLTCVSEKTDEEEDSDETLDVQRLTNLYWYLRDVYFMDY